LNESDDRDIGDDADYWRIVERMVDGFYRVSVDGRIIRCSPKAVRTLGYDSEDELIGKVTMADLWVNPSERELLLDELREHGDVRGFEATLKRKDGGRVRVEMTVSPVLDANGDLVGTDGVVRDVTESSRSEQQFRSLIRNSPGAIFRYGGEGDPRYTFMSEAVEDITGYPPEFFTTNANPILQIVHPADRETAAAMKGTRARAGEQYSFELRIVTPKNETRWIRIQGSGGTDRITDTDVVDGVILDVTEAHRIAEELAESEAMFHHLFDSMAEGYWVTGPDSRVQLCNAAAVRLLGYPSEESLIDLDTQAIMVSDEQRQVFLTELSANRVAEGRDVDVRRYDGEIITLNFSARLVGDGETLRSETTFRDVTEQKRIDTEIREARHAAEAANRAKSTFLANMSHELRTPLNAIIGYSEMMMEEAEDLEEDVFSSDLKKVHGAGTHLLALINDVLDLSKIEAGRTELFAEHFSVEEIVNSVTATTEPLFAKNHNKFVLDIADGKIVLHQDLTKLRQSLLNLLSNAAKFTDHGTVTLATRVELEAKERWLELSVADSGIGIPENKQSKLFDEFSQVDASTTREYGGTGLGLAISRRFCRLMGGEIELRSKLGEGSTFTIRVPVVLAANPPATVGESGSPVEKAPAPLPKHPGRTVLVVDDDPEACEIISHHLTRSGFETVAALSGAEGLALAKEIRPCAITLDVMMPEMDGWCVLEALKSDAELAEIPVVMVSMRDDKSAGYTLGATSYLTKPVDRDQLLAAIGKPRDAGSEILIIEDDADTRGMLERVLSRSGFRVLVAANGEEGLTAIEQSKPDMILLDLMMPVMDGFDFLLQMRGRSQMSEIPVVVVTAKDLTEDERDFLSGRVENVLQKGAYTRHQLLGLIKVALADLA
jgi:PAS domain S-box-containing protein